VLLLLLGGASRAVASTDLFSFNAREGSFHFSLQMVGNGDSGYPQVTSSDFKGYMPHQEYHVTFDRKSRTAFVRPVRPSLEGLPWFEMTISGDTGTLVYNGRRIKGEASWEMP